MPRNLNEMERYTFEKGLPSISAAAVSAEVITVFATVSCYYLHRQKFLHFS
jgi:hypothetical protein